jgi:hypothetical protein
MEEGSCAPNKVWYTHTYPSLTFRADTEAGRMPPSGAAVEYRLNRRRPHSPRCLSSVPAWWLGSGKRMGHQDFYSDSME